MLLFRLVLPNENCVQKDMNLLPICDRNHISVGNKRLLNDEENELTPPADCYIIFGCQQNKKAPNSTTELKNLRNECASDVSL